MSKLFVAEGEQKQHVALSAAMLGFWLVMRVHPNAHTMHLLSKWQTCSLLEMRHSRQSSVQLFRSAWNHLGKP